MKNHTNRKILLGILGLLMSAGGVGCTSDSRTSASLISSSPSPKSSSTKISTSSSSVARAAKFIFKQSVTGGSFDAPGAGGTSAGAGLGHKATRVFNADGTMLAGGPGEAAWPTWVSSVEVGISGSNNSAATNPSCARFSQSGEDTGTYCNYNLTSGTDTDPIPCGAPVGLFRVSEYDCTNGSSTQDGNGSASDGVYIRVIFDRTPTSVLAPTENVLAVLEYASSALNSAPTTPTSCFANGTFSPTNPGCADMVWQIFLKRSTAEIPPPYLMIAPPASGYVNTTANTGGGGISTKQFIVPLGADANMSVMQISRIKALSSSSTNFTTACSSNSALCVGMIFYSLTLYRM